MLEQDKSAKTTESKFNSTWLPVLAAGLVFTIFGFFAWAFNKLEYHHLPEWVLFFGLLISVLVAFLVRLYQKANAAVLQSLAARTALDNELQEHHYTAGQLFFTIKRLEMATQVGGIGVWTWHVATNSLIWNERMYALYGLASGATLSYANWLSAVHPEDLPATEALLQDAVHGNGLFKTEFRILLPSGAVRYMAAAASVERDYAGRPMQVNGINWDITELKETEISLRERVKELTCLNQVERLIANQAIPEAELCRQALEHLALAQSNRNAAARIELNGSCYQTANYSAAQIPRLTAPIRVNAQESGEITVYCQEAAPIVLPEEQNLLDTIASRLGSWQEQKNAMNEIRKLYQAVVQSPVSIVITDTAGNIEYANPCFTALTGYSLEEVIGQNPRILNAGNTPREEFQQLWETILAGEVWQGQFCNRKKNGEIFLEKATVSAIKDETGTIINFLAVKQDITEQVAIDKKMRQLAENNQALLQAIPDLIFRVGRDATILDYRANSTDILDVSQEKIIGSALSMYLDNPGAVKACIERALQSGQVQSIRTNLKVGDATHVLEARFKSSGVEEAIAIIRDVSQETRLEEMKSEFIIRTTHELRAPIATLLLMVSLIENQPSKEEYDQYWNILKGEINRERHLVDDFLDTGRLESAQFQFSLDSIRIDELIKQVMEKLEYSARDKNISLSLETNADETETPLVVRVDKVALAQALGNLLDNAIKFTPLGGKVQIRAQKFDSCAQISIIDTGIGIPSEDLPLLFNRFFRGSNGIEEEIQGVGLGLYIVRSILEKHAGSIQVQSTLGQGSQFDIWLPLEAEG